MPPEAVPSARKQSEKGIRRTCHFSAFLLYYYNLYRVQWTEDTFGYEKT